MPLWRKGGLSSNASSRLISTAVMVLMAIAFAAEKAEPEGEGGDKEAVSTSKQVKAAVAVMLLGSIAFQMATFYLVNYDDEDIQKYSYQVIGNTISIFSAVLMFQGFNGIVEEKLIEHHPEQEILIDFAQMAVWFMMMQLVTALFSGSLNHVVNIERHCESEKEVEEFRELNLMCFATMMAHMTGFAAINAWTTVQECQYFKLNPACSLLILPLAFGSLTTFFRLTDYLRQKISEGDGQIDEAELKWDEEAEESENDVIGLALSFTSVQTLRFIINSRLPDKEGFIAEGPDLSTREAWTLALMGVFWALCSTSFSGWLRKQTWRKKKSDDFSPDLTRYCNIVQNYLMMGLSWSLLFAAKATVQMSGAFESEGGILAKVVVALGVSFVSFAFIFLLDTIADSDATGDEVDEAIVKIIESIGLVIGFSWESSFDTAVDKIAETPLMESNGLIGAAATKLLLSSLLCVIVVPAYRMYLLPNVFRAIEATESSDGGSEAEEEDEENKAEEEAMQEGGVFPARKKSCVGLTDEKKAEFAADALLKHYETEIEDSEKTVHDLYKHYNMIGMGLSIVEVLGYIAIVGSHMLGMHSEGHGGTLFMTCAAIAGVNTLLKLIQTYFCFGAKSTFLHHCHKNLKHLHRSARELSAHHRAGALDHNLLAHLKKDFDTNLDMISEFIPVKQPAPVLPVQTKKA